MTERRAVDPSSEFLAAVERFRRLPLESGPLDPKTRELVSLAIHASATTRSAAGVKVHINGAMGHGASPAEIADVLITVVPLGVHSFHATIPILFEELAAFGPTSDIALPPMTPQVAAVKADYIERRGYWTDERDTLARLVPEFFLAYMELTLAPWKHGPLDAVTRELVYLAIDCSITHLYAPGIRIHVRNALALGLDVEQILHVVQLAATLGTVSYLEGVEVLSSCSGPTADGAAR